jgi:nucleoside-diphosphate-sugar epimerase
MHASDLVQDLALPSASSYAVTGGQRKTLRQVVATLESMAGETLPIQWGARPYRPREVMHLWNGPVLPGWQPEISLEEGFAALLRETSL